MQDHVLQFWGELNDDQRAHLAVRAPKTPSAASAVASHMLGGLPILLIQAELRDVDMVVYERDFKRATKASADVLGGVSPLEEQMKPIQPEMVFESHPDVRVQRLIRN